VSVEPPATFATLYTTTMFVEVAGAKLMRMLSPATPFTETTVITGEPGLVAIMSKLSFPLPLFCTENVNE